MGDISRETFLEHDEKGHDRRRGAAREIPSSPGDLLLLRPGGRQHLPSTWTTTSRSSTRRRRRRGGWLSAAPQGDPRTEARCSARPARRAAGSRPDHPDGPCRRSEGPGRAPGKTAPRRLRRSRHPGGDRHNRGRGRGSGPENRLPRRRQGLCLGDHAQIGQGAHRPEHPDRSGPPQRLPVDPRRRRDGRSRSSSRRWLRAAASSSPG